MLDIKLVARQAEAVAANCVHRLMPFDVAALVARWQERNVALTKLEDARHASNENARAMKQPLPADERAAKIEAGRALKVRIAELDARSSVIAAEVDAAVRLLPNLTHPDTPVGATDADNFELRRWGTPRTLDFEVRDHVDLGRDLAIEADLLLVAAVRDRDLFGVGAGCEFDHER